MIRYRLFTPQYKTGMMFETQEEADEFIRTLPADWRMKKVFVRDITPIVIHEVLEE